MQILGKAENEHTLCVAIKTHNTNMETLIGKEYAKITLKRFEVLERHVLDYMSFAYLKSDINVKSIDYGFINH